MSRLRLSLLLALSLAACVKASNSPQSAQRDLITEEEIASSNTTNAYEAVQKLRGNFLSDRGKTTILGKSLTPRYVPYGLAFAAAAIAQTAWRVLRLKGGPPVLTADVKAFGFRFRLASAKIHALGWTPRIGIAEGMEQAFAYFASRQAASSR